MKYKTRVLLHRLSAIMKHPRKLFNAVSISKYKRINLFDYIAINKETFIDQQKDATIIIPIYNGYDFVTKLFASLKDNVSQDTKIIVVNDCSPDERILKLIEEYKAYLNITLVNNPTNLGFVKSINIGMRLVTTKYAIWLNSDTVVPKNMVNKLLSPFAKYKNVASTTPFTNDAGDYSFPRTNNHNQLIDSLANLNDAFEHIKDLDEKRNSYTTGLGFCMGINMEVWKKEGELDELAFEKGYGEEVDWCYRVLNRRGGSHKIACNLFVAHIRGGSFSPELKEKLIRPHVQILEKRYPEIVLYKTPRMFYQNKWLVYRQIATLFLIKNRLLKSVDKKYTDYLTYKRHRVYFCKELDPNSTNTIKHVNKKQFNEILNLILVQY